MPPVIYAPCHCIAHFITESGRHRHINVSTFIVEKGFHAGKDTEFDTYILDEDSEDQLLDEMETMLKEGGCVVDYHCCELFPERWFDLVMVLRADNTILYDRLKGRGYRYTFIPRLVNVVHYDVSSDCLVGVSGLPVFLLLLALRGLCGCLLYLSALPFAQSRYTHFVHTTNLKLKPLFLLCVLILSYVFTVPSFLSQ